MEDLNTQRHVLYAWKGRKCVVKTPDIPQLICRFSAALIRTSAELF